MGKCTGALWIEVLLALAAFGLILLSALSSLRAVTEMLRRESVRSVEVAKQRQLQQLLFTAWLNRRSQGFGAEPWMQIHRQPITAQHGGAEIGQLDWLRMATLDADGQPCWVELRRLEGPLWEWTSAEMRIPLAMGTILLSLQESADGSLECCEWLPGNWPAMLHFSFPDRRSLAARDGFSLFAHW